MWKAVVMPVSVGLQETGYAHKVTNGEREITVTHHRHRNYDRIETVTSGGVVVLTGVGRREPDLTPHPEAVLVANALNAI